MIPTYLLALLPIALAQGSGTCDQLADSVAISVKLTPERGVGLARRVGRECRSNFAALYRAGRALNRTSRYAEAGRSSLDVAVREQAERLLNRAARLRPYDASIWFEYGIAAKKRGGLQVDAYRALRRALELAVEAPDSTSPTLLAEIFLQEARRLQDWVDRFRWLRRVPDLGVLTPACGGLGVFCENYTRPADFNRRLGEAPLVGLDMEPIRDSLIRVYNRVLRLVPSHEEAAQRLSRELALGAEWEMLVITARTLAASHGPLFSCTAALALYKAGDAVLADSLFQAAVPQLPETLRRWYTSPPAGLDTIQDFWRRSRPLWLAPYNELLLEYRARLTYAFVVLGDREAGVAGPETPMGDALIRYGWPATVTQLTREGRQDLSLSALTAVEYFLTCIPADQGGNPAECEPGHAAGTARDESGGRWVAWTYEPDRPSLLFQERPARHVAQYVFNSASQQYAALLREKSPLTFSSRIAPVRLGLPVEVARFRGTDTMTSLVGIFTGIPLAAVAGDSPDSLTVGLFVFKDTAEFPEALQHRLRLPNRGVAPVGYRIPLLAGPYSFSLEVLALGAGRAATARGVLANPIWHTDTLMLSDLLLADRVVPRSDLVPTTWLDLSIQAGSGSTRAEGRWIVWEIYGLRIGQQGTASYHVSLETLDRSRRPLALRVLDGIGITRPKQGVRLEWEAERAPAPDGRVLEYVQVQLPTNLDGPVEIVLMVTDRATGRVVASRRFIPASAPHAAR